MDSDETDPARYFKGVEADVTMRNVVKQLTDEFVEYVREQSAHTLTGTTLDERLVTDLIVSIHESGLDPRPDDDGDSVVHLCAHPDAYYDFESAVAEVCRTNPKAADVDRLRYRGVSVYADQSMPDGVCIAVHEDAIVPDRTLSVRRPWLVANPEGVVVIELDADE